MITLYCMRFVYCVFIILSSSLSLAAKESVSIGTGEVTGVYYAAGGAVCQMLVKYASRHNKIRCSVENTAGSTDNVSRISANQLNFAFVQSDIQFQAYAGIGAFAKRRPYRDLRSVFSVHREFLTVIVRENSKINSFHDIKGKRVNIGSPYSGQQATMNALIGAFGWRRSDFSLISELLSAEQEGALCKEDIDIVSYVVGHPSAIVQNVLQNCNSVLVRVEGEVVDSFLKENPHYQVAVIPAGQYPNVNTNTPTIAVHAVLVTSSETSDDLVYQLVKSVFENIALFRTIHPAFSTLELEQMVKSIPSVPRHPGAERYFREAGLLK